MKGKALRRALETTDATRINADIPLITDTTELITPEIAQAMLQRNAHNRPVQWKTVEKYADLMAAGQWQLHGQGIILDADGNILTGQQRLWAVVYSNTNVYLRVSRGSPRQTAHLLDRGRPQSSRDLATRDTGRTHSPTEASLARAIAVLRDELRPSADAIAALIAEHAESFHTILHATHGTKKTRAILMTAAALIAVARGDQATIKHGVSSLPVWANKLEAALAPQTPEQCWGKGAAFGLAMNTAKRIVQAP